MDVEIIDIDQSENGILRITGSLEKLKEIQEQLLTNCHCQQNSANRQNIIKQIKKRWSSFFMNTFYKYITQIEKRPQLAQLIQKRKESKSSQQKKLEQGDIQFMLKYHNAQFMQDWIQFLQSGYLKKVIEKNRKIINESKQYYIKLIAIIIKESQVENPFYKFMKDDCIFIDDQISESMPKNVESVGISHDTQEHKMNEYQI